MNLMIGKIYELKPKIAPINYMVVKVIATTTNHYECLIFTSCDKGASICEVTQCSVRIHKEYDWDQKEITNKDLLLYVSSPYVSTAMKDYLTTELSHAH